MRVVVLGFIVQFSGMWGRLSAVARLMVVDDGVTLYRPPRLVRIYAGRDVSVVLPMTVMSTELQLLGGK